MPQRARTLDTQTGSQAGLVLLLTRLSLALGSLKLGGVSAGVVAVLLMYAAGRVAGAAPATTNKAGYRPTGGDGVELQRLEEVLLTTTSSVYQIPSTEHMAYRLVRTLVYKRGVGIRETVLVIKCGRWS